MMLLEKDSEKRPASAKDVLAALESIEKGDIKESVTEQQVSTENPIYRRIFVGRENELKQLQNAFTGAMSGQGALMMVVGEPGIGKTSVCEELSTFVTLRGGMSLWGHCYEEGSLSLPYLAFVEAIRSYVLDREPEHLNKELGSGATDVARIVSEIREKLHIEPRETESPEEDRYRLMQAVTSFLANASSVKPMLLILEDLHDADRGTLEMLSYISRNLSGTRLLIIGTYRDVEVDRNHPLSAVLAELRRVSSFRRVLLRGLNIDEVRRMLTRITNEEIPVGLAEVVHRQTEGNPLFVQEVVRYLTEEKLLSSESGKITTSGETTLEMSIPEGLRDVIGKRLTLLSNECNQLLSFAAVIGREFRLELLQKVAMVSDDELMNSLEEAKKAAVVEERSGLGATVTYRFAHAFFRQTLYEEMIAPRRIRLHQQVAKALEETYSSRLEEHAAELAEHFSHSSDSADLEKAVSYGEMAAKRATDVYAFGEAARLLEQAIKVQEILDYDDKEKRCDLLMALCEALFYAGEPGRAMDTEASAALSLAEDLNDRQRASHVCCLASQAAIYRFFGNVAFTPEGKEWINRIDRYAEPNTINRVVADGWMGEVKIFSGNGKEGRKLLNRGLELARQLGDPEAFWWIAAAWMWLIGYNPQHIQEALELTEEMVKQPHTGVSLVSLQTGFIFMGETFYLTGQRERAEECYGQLQLLAERTQQPNFLLSSTAHDASVSTMNGHLEETLEIAQRLEELDQELGLPEFTYNQGLNVSFRPYLYLHKDNSFLLDWLEDLPATNVAPRLLCLAYLGRDSEATEILDQWS
ncbi:MAG TPA: AAA family ATPase [Dehalococcoidia bacterium]|nr:AAA family ATPase [Dehalococcoidia bacterium]